MPTPPGGYRAAHGRGLRPPDALSGRRALPGGTEDPGGAGQSQHAHWRLALQGVRAIGGPSGALRRLEFHHTPKHASWLNQVEVELSVLSRQCLSGQRIPDQETLGAEVAEWEGERNERGATVNWRFTATDAREKLARLYPARS